MKKAETCGASHTPHVFLLCFAPVRLSDDNCGNSILHVAVGVDAVGWGTAPPTGRSLVPLGFFSPWPWSRLYL